MKKYLSIVSAFLLIALVTAGIFSGKAWADGLGAAAPDLTDTPLVIAPAPAETQPAGEPSALSPAQEKELEELKDQAGENLIDLGEFFSAEQEQQLLAKIRSIKSTSSIDVLIVTVRQMTGYADSPAGMEDFVYDFYKANGYKDNGFAFGLKNGTTGNRRYTFLPFGSVLADMSTSEFDVMEEVVVDYLADGAFYKAADRFLDMVARKAQGKTIKAPPSYGLILGISVAAAVIVLSMLRSKMRPVREAVHARNYLVPGSFFLRGHNVYFLHRSVSRTERQRSSGGGGGGGGSHGGRSGSF